MLTNGRITCFNSVSRPTRSRRLFSLRGSFVSYVGRNMLFYPIPQSLGCAPYVARITLARKFINDGTFLFGRDAKLPLKENSLLDLVGLETLLKQVILPLVNIF